MNFLNHYDFINLHSNGAIMNTQATVGIIMGSDSDLPIMQAAADILTSFQIPFELTIVSAHRTPERMVQYAQTARERGIQVIIAGAGGAAHLPGTVSYTHLRAHETN
jgi:5-(carboxyamino)imidazole ribonucleotide mutase